jgi:hypothetical protein
MPPTALMKPANASRPSDDASILRRRFSAKLASDPKGVVRRDEVALPYHDSRADFFRCECHGFTPAGFFNPSRRLQYPVRLLEVMAVPEGAAASNKYNVLQCQHAPSDPKVSNGSLVEVSTRGDDPPPENANAARATVADGDLSKDGPIPVKRQLSRDATMGVA